MCVLCGTEVVFFCEDVSPWIKKNYGFIPVHTEIISELYTGLDLYLWIELFIASKFLWIAMFTRELVQEFSWYTQSVSLILSFDSLQCSEWYLSDLKEIFEKFVSTQFCYLTINRFSEFLYHFTESERRWNEIHLLANHIQGQNSLKNNYDIFSRNQV